jgi:uncharacterized Zn finger protein (UPF0148 family)
MIYHCDCGLRIVSSVDVTLVCPQCSAAVNIYGGVMLIEGTSKTQELSERQRELKHRIDQAAARTTRLKSWIAFFRHPGERGLGDTVQRLKSIAGRRAIKEDLRRIERICGCETSVAIARLNEQHPY